MTTEDIIKAVAKEDFAKYRFDLPYHDIKGRLKHIEVEFKYPADSAETALCSIGCVLIATCNIPESKEALKHKVEQFCFNNPGIEVEYTGYED